MYIASDRLVALSLWQKTSRSYTRAGSIAINIDPIVNFMHSRRVRVPVGDLKPKLGKGRRSSVHTAILQLTQ